MKKRFTDSANPTVHSDPPLLHSECSFPRDVETLLKDSGFKYLAYQEVVEAEAAERAQKIWSGVLMMAHPEFKGEK